MTCKALQPNGLGHAFILQLMSAPVHIPSLTYHARLRSSRPLPPEGSAPLPAHYIE